MKPRAFILLGLLALVFAFASLSCDPNPARSYNVTAKVLSINENILQGKMIGNFLGSADGNFSNDVIKVGIVFEIQGEQVLADLELQHSELVFYEEVNEIPLRVITQYKPHWERTNLYIFLHDRRVLVTERYLNFPE